MTWLRALWNARANARRVVDLEHEVKELRKGHKGLRDELVRVRGLLRQPKAAA